MNGPYFLCKSSKCSLILSRLFSPRNLINKAANDYKIERLSNHLLQAHGHIFGHINWSLTVFNNILTPLRELGCYFCCCSFFALIDDHSHGQGIRTFREKRWKLNNYIQKIVKYLQLCLLPSKLLNYLYFKLYRQSLQRLGYWQNKNLKDIKLEKKWDFNQWHTIVLTIAIVLGSHWNEGILQFQRYISYHVH